jgi:hypothetical protein
MLPVLLPLSACLNVLARMHLGGRSEHSHHVTVPARLDPPHTETGLRAVECHAFD